jgi:hypothetical protein
MQILYSLRSAISLGCEDQIMHSTPKYLNVDCTKTQLYFTVTLIKLIYKNLTQRYVAANNCIIRSIASQVQSGSFVSHLEFYSLFF